MINEIKLNFVAISLMLFGARIYILFVIKSEILLLIN